MAVIVHVWPGQHGRANMRSTGTLAVAGAPVGGTACQNVDLTTGRLPVGPTVSGMPATPSEACTCPVSVRNHASPAPVEAGVAVRPRNRARCPNLTDIR